MGGLDAPGFGVEVVGTIADILHGPERKSLVGDGDDATRRLCRQHEGLATKVPEGIGVGEGDEGEIALRKICLKDFEFGIKS